MKKPRKAEDIEAKADAVRNSKLFQILKLAAEELKEKHKLTDSQVLDAVASGLRRKEGELLIPASVFDNTLLSALELITVYMKEELNLSFHQIAEAINRDDRTIWATYHNARKKRTGRLRLKETNYLFPASILRNRRLSVLESIVSHLKDQYGLSYNELAALLHRNARNIWVLYKKARKKATKK